MTAATRERAAVLGEEAEALGVLEGLGLAGVDALAALEGWSKEEFQEAQEAAGEGLHGEVLPDRRPDTTDILPLAEYDLVVVGLSGGKDSVACLLLMVEAFREAGIPLSRLEAWHHLVDGAPGPDAPEKFDWPVTDAYCAALCRELGVAYRRQWREGGIAGEMMKKDARSKGVTMETPEGGLLTVGGTRGKIGTRGRHPAQSADLQARWCSPAVKIDVCNSAVCNDSRLKSAKVLVVTGERREESSNRSRYAEAEKRKGTNNSRRVDHWRAVIDCTEAEVWDVLRRHRVRPHPAYMAFPRVSCMTCVFNRPAQWAAVRELAPQKLHWHAAVEAQSGHTIRQGLTVIQQAERGQAAPPEVIEALRREAMSQEYPAGRIRLAQGEEWALPAGAFQDGGCGPS